MELAVFTLVLKHLHRLWGFTVKLEQLNEDNNVKLLGMMPHE